MAKSLKAEPATELEKTKEIVQSGEEGCEEAQEQ